MSKVAIVVGHNSKYQGAMGNLGVSEFVLNSAIANMLKTHFKDSLIKLKVFHRLPVKSYTKQMKDLAKRVNKFDPNLVLSLHFNAGASKPSGHEVLYYKTGEKYALLLDTIFDKRLPNRDRNLKKIDSINDRGAQLFLRINAPVVLAEPFFSNNQDMMINYHLMDIVDSYIEFIESSQGLQLS